MSTSSDPGAGLSVGAAARETGVTVRTLHHWDAIGLIRPSRRSPAGYRMYAPEDVERIRRVLVYRDFGVQLEEIAELLDAPADEADDRLQHQRERLSERIERDRAALAALERVIRSRAQGIPLPGEEQRAIIGEQWRPEWGEGARARWGDTPQWAQYAERAAHRTPEDWKRIAADVEELQRELAAQFRAGVQPGTPAADALAERHRASMRVYFDCDHALHARIATLFVSDAGFTAYYDGIADGMARWLYEVVVANAERHAEIDRDRLFEDDAGAPGG